MKFFEDIAIGESAVIGAHTFTADAIRQFAAQFDPQPWHLDAAAAMPARLCASGWHVACTWMRLLVDHRRREDEVRRARGEPVATLGPSPGFRDLQWPRPVFAGDTVTYSNAVIDRRGSQTRPGWGLVTARNSGVNQHGELVLQFVSAAFVERKPTRRP